MTSSVFDAGDSMREQAAVQEKVRPSDVVLMQAEWLPLLFAERPTRASLLALKPTWPLQNISVRVHRNISSEFISSVAAPYLALAGYEVEWLYGDYDDSLTFAESGAVDAELVWLDYSRFQKLSSTELASWVASRISDLRSRTRSPILVNNDIRPDSDLNLQLLEATEPLPGVYMCDLATIGRELGADWLDARNQKIAGLPYSNVASVLIGRQLGARWLPAVLKPAIKAIVVDLDQTLYEGVIGEDGPMGLRLSDAYIQLQRVLLDYRERGIFLAICSKNEPEDVWAMFSARSDMLLRPEHLSAHSVSWNSKTLGLKTIANQLRIGIDSMLYIDDNAGELANIAEQLPGVHLLHAGEDPSVTGRALADYPGLHRWRSDETDSVRIGDLAAAAERISAPEGGLSGEYLKSLRSVVKFRVSMKSDGNRLHELSNKTNQFNLRLSRFQPGDVHYYITNSDCRAIGVDLADRLSDSGIVAAVFTRIEGDQCYVDEVCVSCRALGRGLEDLLVLGAVRAGFKDGYSPSILCFRYAVGPRNRPALQWLEQLVGGSLSEETGIVRVDWTHCLNLLSHIEPLIANVDIQFDS